MKYRHIALWLTITILLLAVGLYAINALGFFTLFRAYAMLDKLREVSQHVPGIPGGVSLQRIEGMQPSRVPGCQSVHIYALYGTNDLSFTEVLDTYTARLESAGWQLSIGGDFGRSFKTSDDLHLEVSDNYRFLPFDRARVLEGQEKFKTLFLFALTTSVYPNVPSENCR